MSETFLIELPPAESLFIPGFFTFVFGDAVFGSIIAIVVVSDSLRFRTKKLPDGVLESIFSASLPDNGPKYQLKTKFDQITE